MAVERTISIIKPDAVTQNVIGQSYARFEQGGLKLIAAKMLHVTKEQAGGCMPFTRTTRFVRARGRKTLPRKTRDFNPGVVRLSRG